MYIAWLFALEFFSSNLRFDKAKLGSEDGNFGIVITQTTTLDNIDQNKTKWQLTVEIFGIVVEELGGKLMT